MLYLSFFLCMAERLTDDFDETLLTIHDNYKLLPSPRTIFLNRDFLKQGHVKVTIENITDFTVYMWDNRFVPELVVNRDNIPPVTEVYRRNTCGDIDSFRRCCTTLINMETREMLADEVRAAFQDETTYRITTWREGINLLNENSKTSGSVAVAYECCHGPAFSGNWALMAQDGMMKRNNIVYRKWDLQDKRCPNGWLSHIYSSTKGQHLKDVDGISAKQLRASNVISSNPRRNNSYTLARNHVDLTRDPNYVSILVITAKLNEMAKKGNQNPSIVDIKKMLLSIKKTNLNLCRRLSVASATVRSQGNEVQIPTRNVVPNIFVDPVDPNDFVYGEAGYNQEGVEELVNNSEGSFGSETYREGNGRYNNDSDNESEGSDGTGSSNDYKMAAKEPRVTSDDDDDNSVVTGRVRHSIISHYVLKLFFLT